MVDFSGTDRINCLINMQSLGRSFQTMSPNLIREAQVSVVRNGTR